MQLADEVLNVATPVTIGMIILEATCSVIKRDGGYAIKDTIASVITSLGYQWIRKFLLASVFIGGLLWAASLSPWSWSASSPVTWMVCFLLVDFFYYWDHRLGHELNILWIFHNIHHSSEHFNLAVASRLSWVEEVYRWIFLAPIAMLGIPVPVIVFMKLLHRLYQVPVHTQYIGKLGWLEYVLATPSQHRVHHGRNEQYLDKNYGGVLCIWDRLFQTFESEEEPVEYGLVKQIQTTNPIRIQWIGPQRLWEELKQPATTWEKITYLFKKPGSPLREDQEEPQVEETVPLGESAA
ncbi:sterol desaturase family protein [Oligoflexus tunisiensis]|uniref:sterol desaturase family protein n=1 Tax=Oligoflexus tunisiensis TaxID=708132 RepID=UPI001FDFF247|nr:sterol desaturase family protein [Oligoflexus tunisiensis]